MSIQVIAAIVKRFFVKRKKTLVSFSIDVKENYQNSKWSKLIQSSQTRKKLEINLKSKHQQKIP